MSKSYAELLRVADNNSRSIAQQVRKKINFDNENCFFSVIA